MRARELLHSFATVYLLGSVSMSASAADSSPTAESSGADAGKLEEVIVTAEKRAERLSDVPISITALSGSQLERQGITSPTDLPRVVPGLTFALSNQGGPVYTLRGVGFYSDSIDTSPAVSVYVDQVSLPFPRMAEGAALDLERVEVLKGPQGTLFGQNSTGGAINYIAAKPTPDLRSGVDVTYGRYNEIDLGGFISGPIDDTLRARLAFRSETMDGWQHNYVPLGTNTAENKNGVRSFANARLLADWTPTDDLMIDLNLSGWTDHSDGIARQLIQYAPLVPGGYPGSAQIPNLQALLAAYPVAAHDPTVAGFDPGVSLRRDDNFYQGAVRADYSLQPNLTLTSITAFDRLAVFDPQDGDATIYPDNLVTVSGTVYNVSQELRLAGNSFQDRFKWLLGANYEYDHTANTFHVHIQGTNSGLGPFRFYQFDMLNSNKITTGALFGSVNYRLTDALSLEGSARGTFRDDAFTGCVRDTGDGGTAAAISFLSSSLTGAPQNIPAGRCTTLGDDFAPIQSVSQSLNERNLSYRVGVSWKIQPEVMLYANVAKGYKGGAFETLPAVIASQYRPDRQESVLAYEAGVKSSIFDHRMTVNAAAFHYDYTNKQLDGYVDTLFGLLSSLVSIPKARVDGGEVELAWRVTDGLKLSFGGTYVDTAVTSDFRLAGAYAGTVDIKGAQFPNTPKWQLNADAEYDFPLAARFGGYVGGSAKYHSSTPAAFGGGPLFQIENYALLDLRAGIESNDGRWNLQLWGRNVTNKYYWNSVEHQEDAVVRSPGMPATYGITFRARF